MLALMKRTDPSAKTWLAPPVWKLYTSLLLVQLVWHGPGLVVPSAVKPWVMYSLSWSAQPPSRLPVGRGQLARPASGRAGRRPRR